MELSEVAKPGLMISQTWPDSRRREGETVRATETALAQAFFQALQFVEVPFERERRQIATITRDGGVDVTYCLARVLNENRLNLSSLDERLRQKSVKKVINCLDDAREMGAQYVQLLSGPGPGHSKDRPKALAQLQLSLLEICEFAIVEPSLEIVVEPLDIHVHKKMTLGSAREAVQIVDALKQQGSNVLLCLDTAHLVLNREDPLSALILAGERVAELHFCNCVTDKIHPLFGDHHIRFGPPGSLGVLEISTIMAGMLRDKFFLHPGNRPGVFCEVLKRPEDDSIELMNYCQKTLEDIWFGAQQ